MELTQTAARGRNGLTPSGVTQSGRRRSPLPPEGLGVGLEGGARRGVRDREGAHLLLEEGGHGVLGAQLGLE